MSSDFLKVMEHVQAYFKEHLPNYNVIKVKRKGNYNYLYMVSARKVDGTFTVWTAWNESTGSLNHGHYDLESIEECEKIFQEFQNI